MRKRNFRCQILCAICENIIYFIEQKVIDIQNDRQISRNDEIFDVPAQLLCREFYQKHYGQGLTVNQTCENDVTLLNCSFVEETRTYLNPIEESDPDQIASVFKKGFQNAITLSRSNIIYQA